MNTFEHVWGGRVQDWEKGVPSKKVRTEHVQRWSSMWLGERQDGGEPVPKWTNFNTREVAWDWPMTSWVMVTWGPPPWSDRMTDRHDWKHYFLTTSLAGGKYNSRKLQEVKSEQLSVKNILLCSRRRRYGVTQKCIGSRTVNTQLMKKYLTAWMQEQLKSLAWPIFFIVLIADKLPYYYDDYCLALLLKGVCLKFRGRGQEFQAEQCFREIWSL